MVQVEERFMIQELFRSGVSISEIARRTGGDRKTVRSVINGALMPAAKARPAKVRKIDPFATYLEKRIEQGVRNAEKLYQEIQVRGYTGKVRMVRQFVQPCRTPKQPAATVRFETEPGQQAQVDWDSFGMIDHFGRQRRLYAFVMTLGWSRAMYIEFTVSMDATWWLRCHLHAFHYFGGARARSCTTISRRLFWGAPATASSTGTLAIWTSPVTTVSAPAAGGYLAGNGL